MSVGEANHSIELMSRGVVHGAAFSDASGTRSTVPAAAWSARRAGDLAAERLVEVRGHRAVRDRRVLDRSQRAWVPTAVRGKLTGAAGRAGK
jgi:hypothetical protein